MLETSDKSNSPQQPVKTSEPSKYIQYHQTRPVGDETKRSLFSFIKELKKDSSGETPTTSLISSIATIPISQAQVPIFQGKLSKTEESTVPTQENSSKLSENDSTSKLTHEKTGKLSLTDKDRKNLTEFKKM